MITLLLLQQVFRPRTPPEAIDLVSRLLEYTPTSRINTMEACAHPFFHELRQPQGKMPNGREYPPLFNFTPQGEETSCSQLLFLSLYASMIYRFPSLPPTPSPRTDHSALTTVCVDTKPRECSQPVPIRTVLDPPHRRNATNCFLRVSKLRMTPAPAPLRPLARVAN